MATILANTWSSCTRFAGSVKLTVERAWPILNSPLIVSLVAGFIISDIARSYQKQDEAAKEWAERRDKLDNALTELQQRISYLESADKTWTSRCNYSRASIAEWGTINGRGGYVATTPAYNNTSIAVVLTDAERNSNAWDPGYVASRWVGAFSVRPPRTAWFVRIELPWLQRYVSGHMFASSVGHLPLRAGQPLTTDLQKELGIPTLREAEQSSQESDKTLQHDLATHDPKLTACTEHPARIAD